MPLTAEVRLDSVSKVVGGGYVVPSKSTPGAFRLVYGNECSCPATGPTCRHRKLVAAYCAAEDREALGKRNCGCGHRIHDHGRIGCTSDGCSCGNAWGRPRVNASLMVD